MATNSESPSSNSLLADPTDLLSEALSWFRMEISDKDALPTSSSPQKPSKNSVIDALLSYRPGFFLKFLHFAELHKLWRLNRTARQIVKEHLAAILPLQSADIYIYNVYNGRLDERKPCVEKGALTLALHFQTSSELLDGLVALYASPLVELLRSPRLNSANSQLHCYDLIEEHLLTLNAHLETYFTEVCQLSFHCNLLGSDRQLALRLLLEEQPRFTHVKLVTIQQIYSLRHFLQELDTARLLLTVENVNEETVSSLLRYEFYHLDFKAMSGCEESILRVLEEQKRLKSTSLSLRGTLTSTKSDFLFVLRFLADDKHFPTDDFVSFRRLLMYCN